MNTAAKVEMRLAGLACLACLCLSVPGRADVVVNFPDPHLEAIIREAINKPEGDILDTDLVGVGFTQLAILDEETTDLTGIEYCTDLEEFFVGQMICVNPLSLLTQLPNLRRLGIDGCASGILSLLPQLPNLEHLSLAHDTIGDGADAIAVLQNLRSLSLDHCDIGDIDFLSELPDLTLLNLAVNHVTDISALAGLTQLQNLDLYSNSISDITPLAGLTQLSSWIRLDLNLIADIGPLVANPGIDADDDIYLQFNPLDSAALCDHISALEARGVNVRVTGGCGSAGPVITRQPGAWYVEVGRPCTISLEATGAAKAGPLGYTWRRDGVILNEADSSVTIDAVCEEDTGWYQCVVADQDGVTLSQAAHLQVVADGAMPAAGTLALLISAVALGGTGAACATRWLGFK